MPKYLYVDRNNLKLNRTRQSGNRLPTVIVSDGVGVRRRVDAAVINCPHCSSPAAVLRYEPLHPIDDDANVFVEAFGQVATELKP